MNPFMWMIVQPMIVWLIVYAVIFGNYIDNSRK
jgi:hypothetical protein